MKHRGTIFFGISSGIAQKKCIIKELVLTFLIQLPEQIKNCLIGFRQSGRAAEKSIHVSVKIIGIHFESLITRPTDIVLIIVDAAATDPKSNSKLRLRHFGIFAKRSKRMTQIVQIKHHLSKRK